VPRRWRCVACWSALWQPSAPGRRQAALLPVAGVPDRASRSTTSSTSGCWTRAAGSCASSVSTARSGGIEVDAALGNGGLGRLAACFLDSLALHLPGFGYGIDYEFGLFRQEIRNGEQVEKPDNWRDLPSPWLVERPQEAVLVPLYGHIESSHDRHGNYNPMWLDWRMVIGVPADLPVVGHGGQTVNYLRLYAARASHEFDMSIFNEETTCGRCRRRCSRNGFQNPLPQRVARRP
jgi:glucan phosphorylase